MGPRCSPGPPTCQHRRRLISARPACTRDPVDGPVPLQRSWQSAAAHTRPQEHQRTRIMTPASTDASERTGCDDDDDDDASMCAPRPFPMAVLIFDQDQTLACCTAPTFVCITTPCKDIGTIGTSSSPVPAFQLSSCLSHVNHRCVIRQRVQRRGVNFGEDGATTACAEVRGHEPWLSRAPSPRRRDRPVCPPRLCTRSVLARPTPKLNTACAHVHAGRDAPARRRTLGTTCASCCRPSASRPRASARRPGPCGAHARGRRRAGTGRA